MLALKRKAGEVIYVEVGDVVVAVHIAGVQNGAVKMGFSAPAGVKIWRKEIAPAEVVEKVSNQRDSRGGV